MKLDPYLTPLTKINTKWVKELNIKPKTIKLPQENMGKKHQNMGNNFLHMTPKSQTTKAKSTKETTLNLKSST